MKRWIPLFLMLIMCFVWGSALAELVIPTGTTVIGDSAFYGDSSLNVVVLPNGIQRIETKAFRNCGLTRVNLPDSLIYIADDAFDGNSGMTVEANQNSQWYTWAKNKGFIVEETSTFILKHGNELLFNLSSGKTSFNVNLAASAGYNEDTGGDTYSISVNTNLSWSVSSNSSWFSMSKNGNEAKLTINENVTYASMTGTATFTAGGKTITMNVRKPEWKNGLELLVYHKNENGIIDNNIYYRHDGHQEYNNLIELSPKASCNSSGCAKYTMYVDSNFYWSIYSNENWFEFETNEGYPENGINELVLKLTRNVTDSKHTGKFYFYCGDNEQEIEISVEKPASSSAVTPDPYTPTLSNPVFKNMDTGAVYSNKQIVEWNKNSQFNLAFEAEGGSEVAEVRAFLMNSQPQFDDTDAGNAIEFLYPGNGTGVDVFTRSELSEWYGAIPFGLKQYNTGQYVKIWIAMRDVNYDYNEYKKGIQFALKLTQSSTSYPSAYTIPTLSGTNAEKMLQVVSSQIGYTENGTNMTVYGAYTGKNGQPWCASFISWAAKQAGLTSAFTTTGTVASPYNLLKSGYTVAYYNEYPNWRSRAGNTFLYNLSNASTKIYDPSRSLFVPQEGDIIFFATTGGAPLAHVGIITEYNSNTHTIKYIDGNGTYEGDGTYNATLLAGKSGNIAVSKWSLSLYNKLICCIARPNY